MGRKVSREFSVFGARTSQACENEIRRGVECHESSPSERVRPLGTRYRRQLYTTPGQVAAVAAEKDSEAAVAAEKDSDVAEKDSDVAEKDSDVAAARSADLLAAAAPGNVAAGASSPIAGTAAALRTEMWAAAVVQWAAEAAALVPAVHVPARSMTRLAAA